MRWSLLSCPVLSSSLPSLFSSVSFSPFPLPFLAEKLKTDPYLNNTSLREWDLAAGFKSISFCTTPLLVRGGIWELYRKKGICAASCAEGVSILKTAAQILIEAEK